MNSPEITIATIKGIQTGAAWEEDMRTCSISVEAEIYEGGRFGYVSAVCEEDGTAVRVDLDGAGWRDLAKAALEMADRFDASDHPGEWKPIETIERFKIERSELLDVIGEMERRLSAANARKDAA